MLKEECTTHHIPSLIFDYIEPEAMQKSSWKAVIILFPFGSGITKVPTNVCPAGTAPDIWQAVVALVTIRFQITVIAFHELFCMAATSGWRIAI